MNTSIEVIGFGKHGAHTFPWVLLNDPNYFYWGIQNKVWQQHEHLKSQAEILDHRSRHILVPGNEDGLYQVHYLIPTTRKILRKVLVLPQPDQPTTDSLLGPFDVGLISDVLDLSYPRTLDPRDNHHGPRIVIAAVSQCYYRVPNIAWDEAICQQFFFNDFNFR